MLSKVAGFLKLAKFGTVVSMGVSVWAYSLFYGWPFAAGMVSLIFVHEMGHAIAMRQLGIKVGPMTFIPFIGAVVQMKGTVLNAYQEAYVALGGPILGSAAAAAVLVAANGNGSEFLYALSNFGFMINLFNLIPVGYLDGGRIAGSLSKWFLVGGLGIGGAALITGAVSNPIMYLVLMGGGYNVYERFSGSSRGEHFYKMSRGQTVKVSVAYFGLIAALIMAMGYTGQFMTR